MADKCDMINEKPQTTVDKVIAGLKNIRDRITDEEKSEFCGNVSKDIINDITARNEKRGYTNISQEDANALEALGVRHKNMMIGKENLEGHG